MLEAIATKDLSEAHQDLTAGDKSLDEMADLVLSRVARFFSECVDDESFCAIAVDEKRSIDGKLMSLTLVPCDDVGGSPARRVPKEMPLVLHKA